MFTNSAKPIDMSKRRWPRDGDYGFDKPDRNLFFWSVLLQRIISQAGSYLLTGVFHERECGIYKSEGGCKIMGKDGGDLVLKESGCYFDYDHKDSSALRLMAALITQIVLKWDPNNPSESMVSAAEEFVVEQQRAGLAVAFSYKPGQLKTAIEKSQCGGVFGGNALTSLFGHNPFAHWQYDREYTRYCYTKFSGKTDKEVDQMFADEDLSMSLLKQLQDRARELAGGYTPYIPICCSPRREKNRFAFWVNTGASTQIDGWKTQAELEKWIKSGTKLIDKSRE